MIAAAFLRSDRAAAAVEMALVLPMVMALIFGGFEAGNYMLTEHKVIKGVRDGARYAARLDYNNYDCATGDIDAAAESQIIAVTRTGQATGSGTVRVSGWGADEVFVSLSCDDTTTTGIYADLGTAPRVLVSTVVPYPSILGLLGFNTNGAVVRAQAQSAVMGL
jgi:Flp pilus assembly protein TadG